MTLALLTVTLLGMPARDPSRRTVCSSRLRRTLALVVLTIPGAGACGLFFNVESLGGKALELDDSAAPDAGTDAPPTLPSDATLQLDGDPGEPPPDTACTEPWTLENKKSAGCAARRVALVESNLLFTQYVAIARTKTARIGVLYNKWSVEQDDLQLSHFVESATWPPEYAVATMAHGFTAHVGTRGRIVAGSEDVFHVLEHEYINDGPGPVLATRLVNGTPPFSSPDLVASGVPLGTHLGMARASSGHLHVTWYVKGTDGDAGTPGRVLTSVQAKDGDFAPPQFVATDLVGPPGVTGSDFYDGPSIGQLSLAVDSGGSTHLLLQHQDRDVTTLRYYVTSSGGPWGSAKLVDFTMAEQGRRVYHQPRIALRNAQKVASYFTRNAGEKTAELRVATWKLDQEKPNVEIVARGISAEAKYPSYAHAMVVDPWGLIHLAVVAADAREKGTLSYIRQTRAGDRTVWIEDIVDGDVLGPDSNAFVDMVVDERGRPHIAYLSSKDNNMYYATRTDR